MSFFSPIFLALFLLLGSLAGFLAGLLGIGGGIILVPLFIWVFPPAGFSPEIVAHCAFATSLAIIVPTALSSTLGHRKRGNVKWRQVMRLCLGGILGSVCGASLAALLAGAVLKVLFGAMQILIGIKMMRRPKHLPPERQGKIPGWQLFLVGVAGGFFSAFFGVGGGVVAVPLMVMVLQLPTHLAVGNSSALIVASSFFGAASYVYHGWGVPGLPPFSLGYVNLLVAAMIIPLTTVFARLGVRVAGRLPHDRLSKIFAVVLLIVGAQMIVGTLI